MLQWGAISRPQVFQYEAVPTERCAFTVLQTGEQSWCTALFWRATAITMILKKELLLSWQKFDTVMSTGCCKISTMLRRWHFLNVWRKNDLFLKNIYLFSFSLLTGAWIVLTKGKNRTTSLRKKFRTVKPSQVRIRVHVRVKVHLFLFHLIPLFLLSFLQDEANLINN